MTEPEARAVAAVCAPVDAMAVLDEPPCGGQRPGAVLAGRFRTWCRTDVRHGRWRAVDRPDVPAACALPGEPSHLPDLGEPGHL